MEEVDSVDSVELPTLEIVVLWALDDGDELDTDVVTATELLVEFPAPSVRKTALAAPAITRATMIARTAVRIAR